MKKTEIETDDKHWPSESKVRAALEHSTAAEALGEALCAGVKLSLLEEPLLLDHLASLGK